MSASGTRTEPRPRLRAAPAERPGSDDGVAGSPLTPGGETAATVASWKIRTNIKARSQQITGWS